MIQPSLTSEAGQAWLQLQEPHKAQAPLLDGLQEAVPRDRVLYLGFLARSQLMQGDIQGASTRLNEAADLATQINSNRAVRLLRDVHRQAPRSSELGPELTDKLAALD